MIQVYDDVEAHHWQLPGDVPRKGGATHIGMFFAWCVAHGLASDWHAAEHPGELARLKSRWYSGRDYVLRFMDGKLTSEHLVPTGQAFAADYVVPGTYLHDYGETLQGSRPSLYHVPDTWQSYERLEPKLDARFAEWQARTAGTTSGAAAAAAVAVPAEPEPEPEPAPEPAPEPEPEVSDADAAASGQPAVEAGEGGDDVSSYREVVQRQAPPTPPPLPPRERARAPAPVPRKHRPGGTSRRRDGRTGVWILLALFFLFYGCVRVRSCQRAAQRVSPPRFESFPPQPRGTPGESQPRFEDVRRRLEDVLRRRSRMPESLPVVAWPEIAPAQQEAAEHLGVPVRFENDLKMRFVLIPGGAFIMGSPPTERERHEGEVQHNVVVRPFYLMTTEVSNALYRRLKERHRSESPTGFKGFDDPRVPASSVSWDSAREFCEWLTQTRPPRTYRLPTEAEWEYACRAGALTRFPWGDDEAAAARRANLADESLRAMLHPGRQARVESERGWRWWPGRDGYTGPAPVGTFPPNAWGLHDMIGNVYEWCADWAGPYDVTGDVTDPKGPLGGTMRVIRGGAADAPVWKGRCAWRGALAPNHTAPNVGFRVVCPVP